MFCLRLKLFETIQWNKAPLDRESFIELVLKNFEILGVHEGTVLTEDADWVLDSGEAPRDRDWVGGADWVHTDFYFETLELAEKARTWMEASALAGLEVLQLGPEKVRDWNEEWKKFFLANEKGWKLEPFWRVIPGFVDRLPDDVDSHEVLLRINPGAGFGTGTHETTQLCLRLIGENIEALKTLAGNDVCRWLDFGSGSGILAIGAALLSGKVDAVEIDELAIDNAKANAEVNRVDGLIYYARSLDELESQKSPVLYHAVVANILRPVLLEFCSELVKRLVPGGVMILSGLIEKDVESVKKAYLDELRGRGLRYQAVDLAKNEWRALGFSPIL